MRVSALVMSFFLAVGSTNVFASSLKQMVQTRDNPACAKAMQDISQLESAIFVAQDSDHNKLLATMAYQHLSALAKTSQAVNFEAKLKEYRDENFSAKKAFGEFGFAFKTEERGYEFKSVELSSPSSNIQRISVTMAPEIKLVFDIDYSSEQRKIKAHFETMLDKVVMSKSLDEIIKKRTQHMAKSTTRNRCKTENQLVLDLARSHGIELYSTLLPPADTLPKLGAGKND